MEDLLASNASLEATSRELQASNEELDAFSHTVSHDLQAPLRHITGFVSLLLSHEMESLDPTSTHYLNTIAESSNRMGQLIDDLLAFSRTTRMPPHLQRVDSNKLILEVRTFWFSLRKHSTPQWLDGLKFGIYCHWGPQTVQLAHPDKELSSPEAIERWSGEKFSAKQWVDTFSKDNPKYLNPTKDHLDLLVTPDGRPADAALDGWLARMQECIDLYRPDMIWLDTNFGGTVGGELKGRFDAGRLLGGADNTVNGLREQYQQRVAAYYFNQALKAGKEVEFIYKSHDIPPGVGMRDIEDGNLTGLQYDPWMADINMAIHKQYPSPWFFNSKNPIKEWVRNKTGNSIVAITLCRDDCRIRLRFYFSPIPKSANLLVDLLVDVTSKNGRVLLNVPPCADGSFSPQIRKELAGIGGWLRVNGEAIYDTIPWVFYGVGPTVVESPGHHGHSKHGANLIAQYTAEDIRYTQKGNILYAICLDWPGEQLAVRMLGSQGKLYAGDIKDVRLLGCDEDLVWEVTPEALVVEFPEKKPCEYAYCLKIER